MKSTAIHIVWVHAEIYAGVPDVYDLALFTDDRPDSVKKFRDLLGNFELKETDIAQLKSQLKKADEVETSLDEAVQVPSSAGKRTRYAGASTRLWKSLAQSLNDQEKFDSVIGKAMLSARAQLIQLTDLNIATLVASFRKNCASQVTQ